jgi:hypothetical protein
MIGGYWRLMTQQIGANITAWRTWLDEDSAPVGTEVIKRVRLAKTTTLPVETDFGAWQVITSGQNLGTILSDVPPPAAGESRWIDADIMLRPSGAGVSPHLENFLINWLEGSNAELTVTAFIYKKRMYLTGISSTASYNDRLFVLDSKGAWTKYLGLNIFRMLGFRNLIYGLSAADDKIFQMEIEERYDFNGTAIEASIDTGAIDFGHIKAELQEVKIGVSQPTKIEVLLSYDVTEWTSKGTITFTEAKTYRLRIAKGWLHNRHYIRLKSAGNEEMGVVMLKAVFQGRAEA